MSSKANKNKNIHRLCIRSEEEGAPMDDGELNLRYAEIANDSGDRCQSTV